MAFSMFSNNISPIAIDFGSASVKLLQVGTGEKSTLLAAAELPIPDSMRSDPEAVVGFLAEYLPKTLKDGRFKGKRVVCSVPSSRSFVQHMQLAGNDSSARAESMKLQLATLTNRPAESMVTRAIEVTEVHRGGQKGMETICLAMGREAVMKQVELLKRCKLETVGVHTEVMAIVRAFDHLHRRTGDEKVTTMYVDLGWAGTKVVISHGRQLVFARCIQIGGRHFDQLICDKLHCDVLTARAHRLSAEVAMQALAAVHRQQVADGTPEVAGNAILKSALANAVEAEQTQAGVALEAERRIGEPAAALRREVQSTRSGGVSPANVDFSEMLDTISDELSMCLRYHRSLFPDRQIDRVIFLGGESRQMWLAQHVVRVLRLPAQLGDPLARLAVDGKPLTPNLTLDQTQPGWAVACGLCSSQTDL